MRSKKKTRNLIRKYFKWWVKYLGLGRYKFELLYATAVEWSRDKNILAYVCTDWRYQDADIYFNLQMFRELSKDDIEYYVLHELCHVLVNEMKDPERQDHEERVVTDLTNAFLWVRNAARS